MQAAQPTRDLARFAARLRWSDLPAKVQHNAVQAFINWVGCALGGAAHPAVDRAMAAFTGLSAGGACTVLGRSQQLDPLGAALVNGLSVSVNAYDDAHLETVVHPTAPSVGALLAHAEQHPVSGQDFLLALVLSNEIQCRLSRALAVPPAACDLGWYLTGVTGAVGVAAGLGKVMGLSEQRLAWAMGIGAMQAGGLRASHGTMCSPMIPGDAGRNGLLAARLAAQDFTCNDEALAATHGLLPVFGEPAHAPVLTEGLGEHWECLNVGFKPFPNGCLVHAVTDACLQLVRGHAFGPADVERVEMRVFRLALGLTGRREPKDGFEAQASIFHWAAAVLAHRQAGLAEATDACVQDPAIITLRSRIAATVDEALQPDEAQVMVVLRDGRRLEAFASPCIGSARRPMTDDELQAKFLLQAAPPLGRQAAARLADLCWSLAKVADVGRAAPGVWGASGA
ncbi:MAG TPA: MmgE/PrpD family protein [Ramlibacter sp.]|nr:MmgE/PrpD family protein [Ramlibacter sp.]